MPSSCLYKWSKKGDVVTHFRDYQLRIQDNALTRQFRDLVQDSQIDIVLEANIQQAIWYKLLVNLGINSITALGRQTVAIMHNPEIRILCRQLLTARLSCCTGRGVKLFRTNCRYYYDYISRLSRRNGN